MTLTATDMAPGVARRLRALMEDMEIPSVVELARYINPRSINRSQASNWVNGLNLPPVPVMAQLAKKAGLTLDWIYLGDPSGLTHAKAIRLQAILDGIGRLPNEPHPTHAPPPRDVHKMGVVSGARVVSSKGAKKASSRKQPVTGSSRR